MVFFHPFGQSKSEPACTSTFALLFVTLAVSPVPAFALNFSVGPLAGYEVLSYRDSPTKLDGGAVQSGDAFEQTSFTGVQAGLTSSIGVVKLDQLEPIVNIDVLMSRLKKSAESEGIKSEGAFNFTHAGLGLGARWWLGSTLSASLTMQFATALSNTMTTTKTVVSDNSKLGTVDYEVSKHKKTSLVASAQWLPMGEGLTVGADFRIGSGCFDCKSNTTALQNRAYLTRSGALTVGWILGHEVSLAESRVRPPSGGQKNLKNIRRPSQQQKKKLDEIIENEVFLRD